MSTDVAGFKGFKDITIKVTQGYQDNAIVFEGPATGFTTISYFGGDQDYGGVQAYLPNRIRLELIFNSNNITGYCWLPDDRINSYDGYPIQGTQQ